MKKRALSLLLSLVMLIGLLPTVALATEPTWKEVGTVEDLRTALTSACDAGSGDSYIKLTSDIAFESTDTWTPIGVDGYNGADIVTLDGSGYSISGLNAPLFSGGFAGGSGIIIKNLTIKDSKIVSINTQGPGAFIECVDSMDVITLENCHLLNSFVSGSRTGGLIGWTSGYNNQNDGAVKTIVTITGCSVIGCTIIGNGTVGGINGHAGANAWTYTTISNCTVKNNSLTSNDDSYRVGVVLGTSNSGQVDISNITYSGNTLMQNNKGTEIPHPEGQSELFGRAVVNDTGVLKIDGKVVAGAENVKVAEVAINGYTTEHATLAEAITAANNAEDGATVIVTILEDLDLSDWTSMNLKNNMTFTLEGNDKTITGLTAPLFKKVFESGQESITIQNLTIKNPTIVVDSSDTENSAGALDAWHEAYDSNDALIIKNCHVSGGSISANGHVGGLVGYSSNQSEIKFENCSVKVVTLSGNGSIGAIIGHTYNAEIDDCVVSGNVLNAVRINNNLAVGTVIGCTNVGTNYIDVTEKAKSTVNINSKKINETAIGTNLADVVITGGEYYTDPTVADLTWDETSCGNSISVTDGYVVAQRADGMWVLTEVENTNPNQSAVTLTADKTSLYGGGTVTLTVSGVTEGMGVVICDTDDTIIPTYQKNGKWIVTLPNETKSYTFSVTGLGENTDSVKVSVAKDTYVPSPTYYTITFDANGGYCATTSKETGTDGKLNTLPTAYRSYYDFEGWYTEKNGGTKITTSHEFTTDTTVYAHWEFNYTPIIPTPTYYTLSFETNGGTTIKDVTRVSGRTIDLTDYTTTREGYTFTGWYADEWLTEEITSVKLRKDTTVYAGWEKINPFIDVFEFDWFYDDVMYVYEKGLMIGVSTNEFGPEITLNRATIVTTLWRLAGSPVVELATDFTDLPDDWYTAAMKWAISEGIILGYGDGTCRPLAEITHEQVIAILHRFIASHGYEDKPITLSTQLIHSEWAENDVLWAIENNLFDSFGSDISDLTKTANRAEIAAYLHRLCELIKG